MQIYIKTLGVRKQPFNFEFESTVLEVKQALQEKEGIQLDQIRLIYSGDQLSDEKTLQEYNIFGGETIRMVFQMSKSENVMLGNETKEKKMRGKKVEVQIIIKTLGLNKQLFNFTNKSTVLEVKQALQRKEGIQLDQIRLIHSGDQLSDEKTLQEYNIFGGETIRMVFQMSKSENIMLGSEKEKEKMRGENTEFANGMTVALIEVDALKIWESSAHELQEEERLLAAQGTLREGWCASKLRTKSFVVIDTDVWARRVVKAFHQDFSREVAFKTEGVNISRTGRITVISLSLCQPLSIAFIFDLISIGSSIFAGVNNLKDLLESKIIKKITFDCRNDSNALYHQYGISLTNCLDLQVFELGIQIANDSYVVSPTDNYRLLRGLEYVAGGYLTSNEISELSGSVPHNGDWEIWGKRPILDIQWQYAANNIHCINRLLRGMLNLRLSSKQHERIRVGSERYTSVFRKADVDYHADFDKYKDLIMGVVPI